MKSRMFDSETITAGSYAVSRAYNVSRLNGLFALQCTVTGSGTLKLEYQLSNDQTTWGTATAIQAGLTAGNYQISATTAFANYLRVVATETGAVSSATISIDFVAQ